VRIDYALISEDIKMILTKLVMTKLFL